MATAVKNVTPRSRGQSFIFYLGWLVEVTGWLAVVGAAVSSASILFALMLAIGLVFLGRKMRAIR